MANRLIYTDIFRASFPHLSAPHAAKPEDQPKYGIAMMFPKNGVCRINQQASTVNNILAALDEVCLEEFKTDFATSTAAGMGVNFPPKFKDGDTVYQKDPVTKAPIHGQVAPESAGMWILSAKNAEPVGCVDSGVASGQPMDIHPDAVYAGCWARAQLEVTAYTGNHGRVVAIKLCNVQMIYDDERFGGKVAQQAATQAFSGMVVPDSNLAVGTGQGGAMPVAQPAPVAPAAQPAPVAPAVAPAPVAQPAVAPVAQPAVAQPAPAPVAPAPVAPAVAPAPVAPAVAPAPVAPAVAPAPVDQPYLQPQVQ